MLKNRLSFIFRRLRYSSKGIFAHLSSFVDDRTSLSRGNFLANGVTVLNSSLGDYSYINSNSFINNTSIGRYTCIGRDVLSGLGSHPLNRASVHRMFYSEEISVWSGFFFKNDFEENKRINVGSDVWIGARVVLMDGITIGDGAIIATGSVVTKDVPAYSIVGGVPAKQIRKRFSDTTCARLIADPWWEKSREEVMKLASIGYFSVEQD